MFLGSETHLYGCWERYFDLLVLSLIFVDYGWMLQQPWTGIRTNNVYGFCYSRLSDQSYSLRLLLTVHSTLWVWPRLNQSVVWIGYKDILVHWVSWKKKNWPSKYEVWFWPSNSKLEIFDHPTIKTVNIGSFSWWLCWFGGSSSLESGWIWSDQLYGWFGV